MALTDNNSLGIPVSDIRDIISDVMETLGEPIEINGLTTVATIVDAKEAITVFRQNLKQIVVLYNIPIERGDLVYFRTDKIGIIYNIPNEDIVSYNAEMLVFNSSIDIHKDEVVYDEDINSSTYGSIISSGENFQFTQKGYIERLTTSEQLTDMGYRIFTSFKFITDVSFVPDYADIIYFKGKRFKINDIDTVTRGLVTIEIVEMI